MCMRCSSDLPWPISMPCSSLSTVIASTLLCVLSFSSSFLVVVASSHILFMAQLELKVVEQTAVFATGNVREGRVNVPFVMRISLQSSAGTKASVKAPVRRVDNVQPSLRGIR